MHKSTFYNIHDLVSVEVDTTVSNAVKEQISFQIGYFSTKTLPDNIPHKIKVYSYKAHKKIVGASIYYDTGYVTNSKVENQHKKFAFEKKEDGFHIYTDAPILINLFIQLLIYKDGYSFVHAAGVVDKEDNAILFPASGGVGKTAIVGALVQEKGYKLLGDDLVLIHKNGTCLSFPRPFILKEYHRNVYPEVFSKLKLQKRRNSVPRKLLKFILQNLPFYHLATTFAKNRGFYSRVIHSLPLPQDYVAAVSVVDIFGEDSVASNPSILKKVIYMERAEIDSLKLDSTFSNSISTRMFSVIHDEWHEYIRELFMLGATELVELPEYYSTVADSLCQSVANAGTQLLRIPRNTSPKDLFDFYESHTQ